MKSKVTILVFILSFVFIAKGELLQRDLYTCRSQVEGFYDFTISEVLDSAQTSSNPKYLLKVAWSLDVWNQLGDAVFLQGEHPFFQSQFARKPFLSPSPDQPELPSQPTWEEETDYIFVFINESGRGSLSVKSGLDPLFCQRLF